MNVFCWDWLNNFFVETLEVGIFHAVVLNGDAFSGLKLVGIEVPNLDKLFLAIDIDIEFIDYFELMLFGELDGLLDKSLECIFVYDVIEY
jgi:hypothetical protein